MDAVEETTAETTAEVEALAEEVEEIGEVVDTISEIAEQTNLLALNASIERRLAPVPTAPASRSSPRR